MADSERAEVTASREDVQPHKVALSWVSSDPYTPPPYIDVVWPDIGRVRYRRDQ